MANVQERARKELLVERSPDIHSGQLVRFVSELEYGRRADPGGFDLRPDILGQFVRGLSTAVG